MRIFPGVLALILLPSLCLAESQSVDSAAHEEPKLFDHYLSMQKMQTQLSQRSLEDQERLQPQVHRAELAACQRLKKDREEGVSGEEYRRQGGVQFYAFVEQFDHYCETLR